MSMIPDSSDPETRPSDNRSVATRRRFLAGLATTVAGASGGASAGDPTTVPRGLTADGTLSPLVANSVSWGGFSFSLPGEARSSGPDNYPEWVVVYGDADDKSAIENWADRRDDREILDADDDATRVTVRAPATDMGVVGVNAILGRGLASFESVELIDFNLSHTFTEPISSLDDETSVQSELGFSWTEQIAAGTRSVPGADGLAFGDDVEGASMADSRELVRADDAREDYSIDASDILIAVVDTGFNTAGGSILGDEDRLVPESWDAIDDETVDEEGADATRDENRHGSWVASAACADPSASEHQGFAPNADLLAIRALDEDGAGSTADIASAIRHAADQGADLLCLSLGTPMYSAEVERALAYAVDEGTIPIAAAGNDRQVTRWVAHPASSEYAISVGAITGDRDAEDALSSYFHNLGPHPGTTDGSGGETAERGVDLVAPGVKTTALVGTAAGSTRELTWSGTSMAAPMVVGVAALVLAEHEDLRGDVDGLRNHLREYGRPLPNVAPEEGGIMVDAYRAVAEEAFEDDHEDVLDDEAFSRGQAYDRLSDGMGGIVTRR